MVYFYFVTFSFQQFGTSKKHVIDTTLTPLLSRALELVNQFRGNNTPQISSFLDTEMVEITPKLIHEKTSIERERQIQELIHNLNNFLTIHNKFKRTKLFTNIQKDLDYLNAILDNEWVPIPLFSSSSISVLDYEVNDQLSPNQILVSFPVVRPKESKIRVFYDILFDDKCISGSSKWVRSPDQNSFNYFFSFMGFCDFKTRVKWPFLSFELGIVFQNWKY